MLRKLLKQIRSPIAPDKGTSAAQLLKRADEALRNEDLDAAVPAYEEALRADDANALAHYNLGLCLVRVNRLSDAIAAFSRSLELDPARHKVNLALAETALRHGDVALATTHYRLTLASAPAQPAAWMRLAKLEYGASRAWEAALAYEQAWRIDPGNRVAASNYLYCCAFSSEVSASELARRCMEWGQHVEAEANPTGVIGARDSTNFDRRIHIGFLSPDFRDHPMRFFFLPILRAHDRNRFKIYCFNDTEKCDQVQASMRQASKAQGDDTWIDCAGWDDAALAQFMAQERLDVLVDLAGHTRSNRLAMMATRRAPVQITALGYPGTTGLSSMDIKLSDEIADPPGADAFYSERVARLSCGFWCFEPPDDAPPVGPSPAQRAQAFTFGYFGEPCKISNAVLQTWSALLARIPHARLFLKLALAPGTGARVAITNRLQAAGLPLDRVELQGPTVPLSAFLLEYEQVDVVLDTWPFNGGTTTCLALWMGVPVLTMAGESLSSRMGASMLGRIGLDEWIATSPSEYVACAERMAASPELAFGLRHDLRRRMAVLTDAHSWVSEFESLCEQALSRTAPNEI